MSHFSNNFSKLAALALLIPVCILAGCKTDAERAEEKRLDDLYSLDNSEIVKSFQTGIYQNGESYRSIRRECTHEKESKVTNGKWCKKFEAIEEGNHAAFRYQNPALFGKSNK